MKNNISICILNILQFLKSFNFFQKAKPFINSTKKSIMQFKRGYQEETFLKNMNILPKDIEFLCDNCSKVCNNQNNNHNVNLVITYLIFFLDLCMAYEN